MTPHKFSIGQVVDFDAKFALTLRTRGPYEVIRILPLDTTGQLVYRLRSQGEPFERVANEYQLVAAAREGAAAVDLTGPAPKSISLGLTRRKSRPPLREISLAFARTKPPD